MCLFFRNNRFLLLYVFRAKKKINNNNNIFLTDEYLRCECGEFRIFRMYEFKLLIFVSVTWLVQCKALSRIFFLFFTHSIGIVWSIERMCFCMLYCQRKYIHMYVQLRHQHNLLRYVYIYIYIQYRLICVMCGVFVYARLYSYMYV